MADTDQMLCRTFAIQFAFLFVLKKDFLDLQNLSKLRRKKDSICAPTLIDTYNDNDMYRVK